MLIVAPPVRIDLVQSAPILVPLPSGAPSQLGYLLLQNDSPFFLQVFQGGQVGGMIPPYAVEMFELAAIGSPAQVVPLALPPGSSATFGVTSLVGGWLNAIWSDRPLRDWPPSFAAPAPPPGPTQLLLTGTSFDNAPGLSPVNTVDLTGWASLDLMLTNNATHPCRVVVTWSAPLVPASLGSQIVDTDTIVTSAGLEGHYLLPAKAVTATIALHWPAAFPSTDSLTIVAQGSRLSAPPGVLSMHSQGSTANGNPLVFQAGQSVGAGLNVAIAPLFDYTGPAQMWVRLPVAGCSVYLMDFDETGVSVGTPLQILFTDPTLNRIWMSSWRHQLQLSNTTAGAQSITCNVTPNA